MAIGAAAATIAGGVIGGIGQVLTNRSNRRIAREQREWDASQIDKQNLYNSPAEQMKRLIEAGLNPNLVYGSGNVSGNQQSAAAKASTPKMENELAGLGQSITSLPMVLNQYQDFENKKVTHDLIKENLIGQTIQNDLLRKKQPYAETLAKYTSEKAWQDAFRKSTDNQMLMERWLESYPSELKGMKAEGHKKVIELERSKLQYEMDSRLKPYNMTTADSIWARILTGILEQSDWLKKVKKSPFVNKIK